MKYWSAGLLLILLGYYALVTTHLYSDDQNDFFSLLESPSLGRVIEDRYYGDHKEKARQGNVESMLQMYFYFHGRGDQDRAREYEGMLRESAADGSVLARMNIDIFIDHNRRIRNTREELVFRLRTLKEHDQHPEYRDMWSTRRTRDGFATFLSFVAKGDKEAVEIWEEEVDLWRNWDWSHSEWLRGVILARAYPELAERDVN